MPPPQRRSPRRPRCATHTSRSRIRASNWSGHPLHVPPRASSCASSSSVSKTSSICSSSVPSNSASPVTCSAPTGSSRSTAVLPRRRARCSRHSAAGGGARTTSRSRSRRADCYRADTTRARRRQSSAGKTRWMQPPFRARASTVAKRNRCIAAPSSTQSQEMIAASTDLRLTPCLTPHGRLVLAASDDAPELEPALGERIRQAFDRGTGHGLLRLGAAESARSFRRSLRTALHRSGRREPRRLAGPARLSELPPRRPNPW